MFWGSQITLVRLFYSPSHFLRGKIIFLLRIDRRLSSSSIGINGVLITLIDIPRLIPIGRVCMTLVHHHVAQRLLLLRNR